MPSNREIFKKKKHRQFLAEQGYSLERAIEEPHPITKSSVLHDAVIAGQVEVVKLLIEQKIDINKKDEHNSSKFRHHRTPLFLALFKRQEKIVALLLENGVDPEQYDKTKQSGLIHAALIGNIDVLDLLLNAKANIDQEDMASPPPHQHFTALFYAVALGHIDTINFLIERGAKINNSQGKIMFECCSDSFTLKALKGSVQGFTAKTQALESNLTHYFPKALVTLVSSYTPGFAFMQTDIALSLKRKEQEIVQKEAKEQETAQREEKQRQQSRLLGPNPLSNTPFNSFPAVPNPLRSASLSLSPHSCWAKPKSWAGINAISSSKPLSSKKDSDAQRAKVTERKKFACLPHP